MSSRSRETFNLDFIRQNPDLVRGALSNRQLDPILVDTVLRLDETQQEEELALVAEEIPSPAFCPANANP